MLRVLRLCSEILEPKAEQNSILHHKRSCFYLHIYQSETVHTIHVLTVGQILQPAIAGNGRKMWSK